MVEETAGISQEQLDRLLTAAEVAELFDVATSVVRRETRKGTMPEGSVVKFMKYTGYDSELVKTWVPAAGTARETREDGRHRYTAMLNVEEVAQLKALGIEIVDTRAKAKARRDARKAKSETDVTVDAGDESEEADELFGDFDA